MSADENSTVIPFDGFTPTYRPLPTEEGQAFSASKDPRPEPSVKLQIIPFTFTTILPED